MCRADQIRATPCRPWSTPRRAGPPCCSWQCPATPHRRRRSSCPPSGRPASSTIMSRPAGIAGHPRHCLRKRGKRANDVKPHNAPLTQCRKFCHNDLMSGDAAKFFQVFPPNLNRKKRRNTFYSYGSLHGPYGAGRLLLQSTFSHATYFIRWWDKT